MPNGYEATMKLAREHPELIPKLAKVQQVVSKFLVVTDEELSKLGLTEEEIKTFEEYGLIERRGEYQGGKYA